MVKFLVLDDRIINFQHIISIEAATHGGYEDSPKVNGRPMMSCINLSNGTKVWTDQTLGGIIATLKGASK